MGTVDIGYEWHGIVTRIHDGLTGLTWNAPFGIEHVDFLHGVGLAVDEGGYIYRTLDSGRSSSRICESFYGLEFTFGMEAHPSPDGRWFLIHDFSLYESNDTGKTWSVFQRYSSAPIEFNINSHGIGYLLVSNLDYLYATIDSGKTWFTEGVAAREFQNIGSHGSIIGPSLLITSDSVAYIGAGNIHLKTNDAGGGPKPVLSMPRTIDFGDIPSNSILHKSILLRNVSDSMVRIDSLLPFDLNLSMTPQKAEILPHDSLTVDFALSDSNLTSISNNAALATNTAHQVEYFTVTGQIRTSGVTSRAVEDDLSQTVSVYPNPWHDITSLSYDGMGPFLTIIVDANGRVVRRLMFNQPTTALERDGLPSGSYTIIVDALDGQRGYVKTVIR